MFRCRLGRCSVIGARNRFFPSPPPRPLPDVTAYVVFAHLAALEDIDLPDNIAIQIVADVSGAWCCCVCGLFSSLHCTPISETLYSLSFPNKIVIIALTGRGDAGE